MTYYLKKEKIPSCDFKLNEITEKELDEIVNNLSNKYSKGPDNLSNSTLKVIYETIKPHLLKFINHSFLTGVFPDSLKISKITPIYKKSNKTDPGNWRPIAQLSPISKIFEKAFCKQLEKHQKEQQIISDLQFGFKEKHSTFHSILATLNILESAKNNKQHSILISLDLSKAFDTVDIETLIEKFSYYNQNLTATNWISQFFKNREQYTIWQNVESNLAKCHNKSIVQGSSIGPKTFNLFINDITKASNFKLILFADDTNCILSNKDPELLEEIANKELIKIKDFFDANNLIVNINKTSFIHIPPVKVKQKINLKIGSTNLEQKSEIEFLGVLIDENLNFNAHFKKVYSKAQKGLNALIATKNILNYKAKKNIYNSLIHSHISYCALIWLPNISPAQITKLKMLQKKALRIIHNVRFNSHTSYLFHLSKITQVDKIVEKESILLIHKYMKSELPNKILEIINNYKIQSNYTRSQADKIIHISFKRGEKTTIKKIIEHWNKTSLVNRNIEKTHILKKEITRSQNTPILCLKNKCYSCNYSKNWVIKEMEK